MSYDLKSSHLLNAAFSNAGQGSRSEDKRVFGDNLKIGSIVHARLKAGLGERYQRDTNDVHPCLVSALWRDLEGHIEKVEFFHFSTVRKKIFASDVDIADPYTMKKFHRGKQTRISTNSIYIFDNMSPYFAKDSRKIKLIDPRVWPDILVRRAHAIQNSNIYSYATNWDKAKPLKREGFSFLNMQRGHVRSGVWTPDVAGAGIERTPSKILSQEQVDEIASYSRSYFKNAILQNTMPRDEITFPLHHAWPDVPHSPFRVWQPEFIYPLNIAEALRQAP